MSVSEEILKRMADSYRRMRNTVRFLLGNMHGFDPAQHAAGRAAGGNRSMGLLERTHALQNEVVTAYRNYEFHDIYQKIHNFCVVELGGFYLDIIKDRLYTTPRAKPGAALGADGDVSHCRGHGALARPDTLVHRRGDLGQLLPERVPESVFLSTWHALPKPRGRGARRSIGRR